MKVFAWVILFLRQSVVAQYGDLFQTSANGKAETKDICVIGAGFSGLTAARALHDNGHNVVVLEAKNRIGGRAYNVTVGRKLAEVGCQFLDGWNDTNPMKCLAKNIKAKRVRYDYFEYDKKAEVQTFNVQTGKPIRWKKFVQYTYDAYNTTVAEVVKAKAGDDANMIMAGNLYSKEFGLKNNDADLMKFVLNQGFVEGEYGAPPKLLSFKHYLSDEGFEGKTFLLPNGFGQFASALAQGLDVRLNNPVTRIDHSGADHVIVKTQTGRFKCSKVIVTVSLGVLKSKIIKFNPVLPLPKQTAIDKLGMGTLEKVILTFRHKVFTGPGAIYFKQGDRTGTFAYIYDVGNVYGGNMVVAWHGGATSTQTLKSMTDAQIVKALRDEISTITEKRCPKPTGSLVTRWQEDPHIQGSYSYIPVGADPAMMQTISENIAGKVYFAGEHTQPEHFGYAHGAALSGEQAAQAIDPYATLFYWSSCLSNAQTETRSSPSNSPTTTSSNPSSSPSPTSSYIENSVLFANRNLRASPSDNTATVVRHDYHAEELD